MPTNEEQALELVTTDVQFVDPFSNEFMEESQQKMELIVGPNTLNSIRRSRVKREKFIIHKEFRARLNKLKTTNVPDFVKEMVDRILSLKYVPTEGKYCNYLGLSQADFSKISYLDKDREERLQGQEIEAHYIKPGTKITISRKRRFLYSGVCVSLYTSTLTLTSRHLNNQVYPINRFAKTISHYTTFEGSGTVQTARNLEFTMPILEEGTPSCRILNSRVYGTGGFIFTDQGLEFTNSFDGVVGVEVENTKIVLKEVWNYKKRYHTSVGKMIRRLFNNDYDDKAVGGFAEAYASLITVSNPLYDFSIISGEDIKDAYEESNYYAQSNTLGNSCMRYQGCQLYFDMYTKFPDKVNMAVLKRGTKIAARSIMWFIDGKWVFDRIYSTNQETYNLLNNTLESSGYSTIYSKSEYFKLDIDLSEIKSFPYVDTLRYYRVNEKVLTSESPSSNVPYWSLNSTGGDVYTCNGAIFTGHNSNEDYDNGENYHNCEVCGDAVYEDQGYYVQVGRHESCQVCGSCVVECETTGEYFTTADPTVQDYQDYGILRAHALRLFDDQFAHRADFSLRSYANDYGLFILDRHAFILKDDLYYHPEDTSILDSIEETTVNSTVNLLDLI